MTRACAHARHTETLCRSRLSRMQLALQAMRIESPRSVLGAFASRVRRTPCSCSVPALKTCEVYGLAYRRQHGAPLLGRTVLSECQSTVDKYTSLLLRTVGHLSHRKCKSLLTFASSLRVSERPPHPRLPTTSHSFLAVDRSPAFFCTAVGTVLGSFLWTCRAFLNMAREVSGRVHVPCSWSSTTGATSVMLISGFSLCCCLTMWCWGAG